MFAEDIQIVIICIGVIITLNCLVKQAEKIQISFVCFLKTKKTKTVFSTTMSVKIWPKSNSNNCAKQHGESHMGLR